MTELYVFRGTAGKAEMVTDDRSGRKLPPHPFRKWVFSRTIDFNAETRLIGGGDCRQILANVAKDGYHHWPELASDFPRDKTANATSRSASPTSSATLAK